MNPEVAKVLLLIVGVLLGMCLMGLAHLRREIRDLKRGLRHTADTVGFLIVVLDLPEEDLKVLHDSREEPDEPHPDDQA